MELNDDAKQIVRDLCSAINVAVEQSSAVAEMIARLREAGYDLELTLRLDIGLRERHEPDSPDGGGADASLELTDYDRRTLQRMRIRIDEED